MDNELPPLPIIELTHPVPGAEKQGGPLLFYGSGMSYSPRDLALQFYGRMEGSRIAVSGKGSGISE